MNYKYLLSINRSCFPLFIKCNYSFICFCLVLVTDRIFCQFFLDIAIILYDEQCSKTLLIITAPKKESQLRKKAGNRSNHDNSSLECTLEINKNKTSTNFSLVLAREETK